MSSGGPEEATVTVEQVQTDVRVPATFCGTYRHHIDDKGRVAIPAQLRRWLPEGSVVAPGPDSRLMIWPPEEWAIIARVAGREPMATWARDLLLALAPAPD